MQTKHNHSRLYHVLQVTCVHSTWLVHFYLNCSINFEVLFDNLFDLKGTVMFCTKCNDRIFIRVQFNFMVSFCCVNPWIGALWRNRLIFPIVQVLIHDVRSTEKNNKIYFWNYYNILNVPCYPQSSGFMFVSLLTLICCIKIHSHTPSEILCAVVT